MIDLIADLRGYTFGQTLTRLDVEAIRFAADSLAEACHIAADQPILRAALTAAQERADAAEAETADLRAKLAAAVGGGRARGPCGILRPHILGSCRSEDARS